ncbi:hypothetical protein F5887DRAFT_1079592 [Amanita rubescens]|nr:hypothetical protein F5887DRAFT_1079592 [Amanita rubescens]
MPNPASRRLLQLRSNPSIPNSTHQKPLPTIRKPTPRPFYYLLCLFPKKETLARERLLFETSPFEKKNQYHYMERFTSTPDPSTPQQCSFSEVDDTDFEDRDPDDFVLMLSQIAFVWTTIPMTIDDFRPLYNPSRPIATINTSSLTSAPAKKKRRQLEPDPKLHKNI